MKHAQMKHVVLMKHAALLLALLLPLAACNQNAAPPAESDASAVQAPTSDGPSAEAEAAAASAAASEGARTDAPAADGASSDPAAEAAVAAAALAAADGPGLAPGTDYAVIEGGQPYQPLNGQIEVVEVFGYVCPACARFQPMVSAWHRKLPADVRFTYVPAPFGPQWIPYAKAFYVAEAQGLVEKSHDPMFHAIHIAQSLPGEGKTPDPQAIANWYGQYGADAGTFLNAMNSFATDAKVNRGKQFMMRSGVQGTPTMVVNGKYRVIGKSYEDILRITDLLVAQERAANAVAAQ